MFPHQSFLLLHLFPAWQAPLRRMPQQQLFLSKASNLISGFGLMMKRR